MYNCAKLVFECRQKLSTWPNLPLRLAITIRTFKTKKKQTQEGLLKTSLNIWSSFPRYSLQSVANLFVFLDSVREKGPSAFRAGDELGQVVHPDSVEGAYKVYVTRR